MNRRRERPPQRAEAKATRRRRSPTAAQQSAPAAKGRPRGEAADTAFARWLDRVTGPEADPRRTIPEIASAVGLAPNSLWSIRRGRQGVSLTVVQRLVEYSDGELTLESFAPSASAR